MLIQFTVGNYRSIKNPVTLSMVAAKLTSQDTQVDENNTFEVGKDLTLLKSAALYGANASGKSNILHAFAFMRWFVINSSKESQAQDPIGVFPFRLDSKNEQEPSFFEVVFLVGDILYRYGFEVDCEKVVTEWLFYAQRKKEARIFIREGAEISTSRNFKGGQATKALTRPNALFLSVGAQFNNDIATIVLGWFKSVGFISGLEDSGYRDFTARVFSEDPAYRSGILDLIRGSDVGISDIRVDKINLGKPDVLSGEMPEEVREFILNQFKDKGEVLAFKTIHTKLDEHGDGQEIAFDLDDESQGTQKFFYLSGPVIDTLRKGRVLIIDEIEARMHTLLTRKLISLFNSNSTNPNRAQLIFATHDTNLLSKELFRRDQIWFVEKDQPGASHLYSLAELKVKNERIFESDYLQGRYGAIPVLGDLRLVIQDNNQGKTYAER